MVRDGITFRLMPTIPKNNLRRKARSCPLRLAGDGLLTMRADSHLKTINRWHSLLPKPTVKLQVSIWKQHHQLIMVSGSGPLDAYLYRTIESSDQMP